MLLKYTIQYTFDTETLSFITSLMKPIYCYALHVSHQDEHNDIIGRLYQVPTYQGISIIIILTNRYIKFYLKDQY